MICASNKIVCGFKWLKLQSYPLTERYRLTIYKFQLYVSVVCEWILILSDITPHLLGCHSAMELSSINFCIGHVTLMKKKPKKNHIWNRNCEKQSFLIHAIPSVNITYTFLVCCCVVKYQLFSSSIKSGICMDIC